jgi:hypothetical protein
MTTRLIVHKPRSVMYQKAPGCTIDSKTGALDTPVCAAITSSSNGSTAWTSSYADLRIQKSCACQVPANAGNKNIAYQRPQLSGVDVIRSRRQAVAGAVPLNRARSAHGVSPAARWTDSGLWTDFVGGRAVRPLQQRDAYLLS